ncbi:MAG TPA: pilus assembly PilX N-terminal domain-containing protein [Longimicrobium sp.]|jgi:hypothetical protein
MTRNEPDAAPRHRRAPTPTPIGTRGIALPVALLGLVAVSLMVTTALLTSSTEIAVSGAHRDAAAGLYNASGALERYVADRAVSGAINKLVQGSATVAAPDGRTYTLTVAQLAQVISGVEDGARTQATSDETFSVIARPPQSRGRSVGAFVTARRTLQKIKLNINAGATSGGDLRVAGNATISDGRDDLNCDSSAAPYAVQVTAGSRIEISGQPNITGAADTANFRKEALVDSVLGGIPLDTLVKYASIKFGPQFNRPGYTAPTWDNNRRVNSGNTLPADTMYNWGCPPDMDVSCPTGSSQRFVVVAIDATGLQGTTVKINGDYGQGIIVVTNGSLDIQGNFTFRGIILVEQDLKIGGGQAQFAGKIEGAVVAFGQSSTVEDRVQGTAVIRFNRCSIIDAQNALNRGRLQDMPQVLNQRTFAWFELVR